MQAERPGCAAYEPRAHGAHARWPGAQPTFDWRTASEGGNATGASHSLNAVGVHGRGAPPVNHFGQPDVWEFDYEFFAPRWPPLAT